MRVVTFNVQNLRLLSGRGPRHLHGARDRDMSEDITLDADDRHLTAELLRAADADVIVLQEVYDLETLEHFHHHFLVAAGLAPYPERICLPGNDGRGFDVAVLSRRRVQEQRGHAALTLHDLEIPAPDIVDPLSPVFRRDCLMVRIGWLTLFVGHFKSPYPDPVSAWRRRRLEALATRRLIERYFEVPEAGLWLVLGDLNEPADAAGMEASAIAPLREGFSVDLMGRVPAPDRWTYFDPDTGIYHCPDAMLASPALARAFPQAVPRILRAGLGYEAARFEGPHFDRVGYHRPHASDHAAVAIDFPEP